MTPFFVDANQVENERLSRLVGVVNRLRPKFFLVSGDITHSSPGEESYESQVSSILPLLLHIVSSIFE